LLGSIAAEGSPRIGTTAIERRSRSCNSPQFGSCFENFVIRPKVSGQTLRGYPTTAGRETITGRVILERGVIHVTDLQGDAEYSPALRDIEPTRTILGVLMFRGDDLVGVFVIFKQEVQPFTEKQI
jgi:hypothetical protein